MVVEIRGLRSKKSQRQQDPHCDQHKPDDEAYPRVKTVGAKLSAERSVCDPSVRQIRSKCGQPLTESEESYAKPDDYDDALRSV